MIHFSWDDNKAKSNLVKHGIGFDEAIQVFLDEYMYSSQDRIENGEMRWQTIGKVANQMVVLVAHTWFDDSGQECIRIISARKATKKEKQRYEQNRYQNY